MLKFDTNRIEFSPQDVNRGLKLPTKVTAELAEETGIHIGDGCMGIGQKGRNFEHRFEVSFGDNDKAYAYGYFIPLMRRLYGVWPKIYRYRNYFQVRYNYKGLVQFKHLVIGLPVGNKSKTVTIPDIILNSPFVARCIRGITETDGTLTFKRRYKNVHYYPYIKIEMISKGLIRQIETAVRGLGIKFSVLYDYVVEDERGFGNAKRHMIMVSGKKNVLEWKEKIGFSNPRNIRRLETWNRLGFVPKDMLFNRMPGARIELATP